MANKAIYIAEKDGRRFSGTAEELGIAIGKSARFVQKHSCLGLVSRDGWHVWKRGPKRVQYIATHPEDDPIIGDCEEVAVLLGITRARVYKVAARSGKTQEGWTIRYVEGEKWDG